MEKRAVSAPKSRGCGKRKPSMSDSEIIAILVVFHFNSFRNFKHYYLHYVKVHLSSEYPNALSYNRFVELMKRVAVPMLFLIKLILLGKCTGISFVDSTCIPVCHNKRIAAYCFFDKKPSINMDLYIDDNPMLPTLF